MTRDIHRMDKFNSAETLDDKVFTVVERRLWQYCLQAVKLEGSFKQ